MLTKNGTENGKPRYISDNASKQLVLRWDATLNAWTISGQTPQNEETIRFIAKSDVSNPVDAIWGYLPNGIENEMISAPLMHLKGK